uniref:Uncharacterized protein n=1 Tax=Anguilla anguilla TaxID=7936 RepID=A0A0E9T892_ANGAN
MDGSRLYLFVCCSSAGRFCINLSHYFILLFVFQIMNTSVTHGNK